MGEPSLQVQQEGKNGWQRAAAGTQGRTGWGLTHVKLWVGPRARGALLTKVHVCARDAIFTGNMRAR